MRYHTLPARARSRVPRAPSQYYAEVTQRDGSRLGFVGQAFALVKSPKSRLMLHTQDLDDWYRLIQVPKGAQLRVLPTD